MSKQLYETGDVIQAGSSTLEVTGVSYQEVDGEKVNFVYQFRPKSEVDAERKAQADAEASAEQAAAEAEKAEV